MASKIQCVGLTAVFEKSIADNKKVAFVSSVTDSDLKRRKEFTEKDVEIMSGFPSADDAKKWVQAQGIGWSCKKGCKPESPNQDSFNVLIVENEFALYCVYDGHGPHGHDVSNWVSETVVQLFIGSPDRTTNPKAAFHRAFTESQKLLRESKEINASMSGTTCTMVYHDIAQDRLTVAHVGDSRAVLGAKGKDVVSTELTKDHKPNEPEEKKRIESADPPGRVQFDGFYNYRVFARWGQYPGLNMSRAIGDVVGHVEAGLTAEPDVKDIDLSTIRTPDGGLLLIVCTDGVWEFISNEEAVRKVLPFPPSQAMDAIASLAELGYNRWMEDSDNEISDDITGIYVHLGKPKG